MEDREFFELLYQQWSQTTGAENRFWMSEETKPLFEGMFWEQPNTPMWAAYAASVDEEGNQDKALVGVFRSEEDADFIAGVHGCLPDLIRRLHTAIDEADRLDEEKDGLVVTLANRELELLGLKQENQTHEEDRHKCHVTISDLDEQISDLEVRLRDERGYSSYLQCDINDAEAELTAANAEISKLKDLLEAERSNVEHWKAR